MRSKKTEDGKVEFDWFGLNRHVCDALEDMRRLEKSRNYSALPGLIEEIQVMANRMEAALRDQKDLLKIQAKCSEARRGYKKLQKEYETLSKKVKSLKKVKSEPADRK